MTTNVNDVLTRLENLSKKVTAHNDNIREIEGFKKARVQSIMELSDKLKAQGVDLGLVLDGETDFTAESLANFKKNAQGILDKHIAEADKLDEFFKAAESGDIAKLKEITGEDLSTVDYSVEITSVDDMKLAVAETNEQILEQGISSVSKEPEVLDILASAKTSIVEPIQQEEVKTDEASTLSVSDDELVDSTDSVESESESPIDDSWSNFFM